MDEPAADGLPDGPDGPDDAAGADQAMAGRRGGPSPMMRFLVVVIGVLMLGMGRSVQRAGGIVGVALGALIQLVAVAIIAIAAGLVEWFVRRRRINLD